MTDGSYSYDPLISPNHIRLLKVHRNTGHARLEAILEQHDLQDAIEIGYDAISYTWGQPSFTHQLYIGGQPLNITAHLHGALSFMTGAYIWVDAVCISQNDLEEKAQQIPLMRHIYAGCLEVLVWLGPENSSIVSAMKVLEDGLVLDMVHVFRDESIDTREARRQILELLEKSNVVKEIGPIFENDWFHRLWVSIVSSAKSCR